MKKLLLMFAAVGMLFTACNNNNEPEHIYDDHSADLVGTWTCHNADLAEALIINADGSVLSTGSIFGEEYWENVKGNIVIENGNITMTFEDGDNFTGHFDIIPGVAFSVYNDKGRRFTYNYCANDLADEIVGMWVCNDFTTDGDADMMIETFYDNGKSTLTGFLPMGDNNEQILDGATDYKVVGDLLIITIPAEKNDGKSPLYVANELIYTPDGTAHGDILTMKTFPQVNGEYVEATSSWLRIKQNLDLANTSYDYDNIYVTNVKGLDRDIEFMGYTVNFAKMDGSMLDKMLKNILFNISFPDANTINYTYHYPNGKQTFDAPIVVEGNKLTVKVSEKEDTLKDVVFYAFQDADNSQLHIYMHKTAFVNFYTNMQAQLLEATDEQFDIKNEEAVNAIYNSINEAVETINLSLVMKAAK